MLTAGHGEDTAADRRIIAPPAKRTVQLQQNTDRVQTLRKAVADVVLSRSNAASTSSPTANFPSPASSPTSANALRALNRARADADIATQKLGLKSRDLVCRRSLQLCGNTIGLRSVFRGVDVEERVNRNGRPRSYGDTVPRSPVLDFAHAVAQQRVPQIRT